MTATVVRAQRPTSVEAGDTALVLGDGTIEGFVGGSCAEHSVRAYALQAIESGEALLLRILPFGDDAEIGPEGREVASEEGAVTVENPCLSGGAIEIFLEPVVPRAAGARGGRHADRRRRWCGSEPSWALDAVAVAGDELEPRPDDLALVVAAHGRDELHALRTRPRSGPALRRPGGQRQARRRRARRAARRRRARGAARADRRARGHRHRRAHARGDRAVDPRRGDRGAPAPAGRRRRPPSIRSAA